MKTFDTVYPGSMAQHGQYIDRDDPDSLAAALLDQIAQRDHKIEDLEAKLSQTGLDSEVGFILEAATKGELAAYDYAVHSHCAATLAVMDGKGLGGSCNEPWATVRARLAALVKPDMFWDDADPEMASGSIHEVLADLWNDGSRSLGDTVTIQQAVRLDNITVRFIANGENDGGFDYEEVA